MITVKGKDKADCEQFFESLNGFAGVEFEEIFSKDDPVSFKNHTGFPLKVDAMAESGKTVIHISLDPKRI